MTFYEGDRDAMGIQIPDVALDMHTNRGRRMGRGRRHFIEEAGRLENETLEDPYFAEGAEAWLSAERPASRGQLELGDGAQAEEA